MFRNWSIGNEIEKSEDFTKPLSVEELAIQVKRLVRHAYSVEHKPTDNNNNMPLLKGKTIQHKFMVDGEETWYNSTLQATEGLPGRKSEDCGELNKIDEHALQWKKRIVSNKLREEFSASTQQEFRVYLKIQDNHEGHMVGENACDILNERLSRLKDEMPGSSWEDLVSAAFFKRIQLSACGFNRPAKTEDFDPNKKGGELVEYLTYGVACTEVEIDVLTGETQALQADLFMDIGKSLNPAIDIGQIEGAFVQGLGMVTSESMEIDQKGRTKNCSSVGYTIPNITSIPRKMTVSLLKNHDVITSFNSSKGIGEPTYLLSFSVMSAIKEAVLAARTQIGKNGYFRLDSPATVQRIQEACGPQINHCMLESAD
ncbi:xanthine dehydrogenase/oxidase-like [Mercenaria mercenaria]|uniref:xanthine dehydrogenase/oxidase-like n=1 Tax=Mercenaria mercenaria TaxID=6596 RepID=UPI00234F2B09|nr:xanthine dehydrogenase/oxidase-like [Mercenaria mercenaria]